MRKNSYLCPKSLWMKKSVVFFALAAGILLAFGGCMRNDDEPALPTTPISRLYVSFETYQQSESEDPIDNVVVIDPADATPMTITLNYNSGALGGGAIHFSPNAGRVFQTGYADTIIRVMSVSNLGILGSSGNFGHHELRAMRGVAYHQPREMLYVANNMTPTAIYGFYQPANRAGFTRPNRVFQLGAAMRPWAIQLWNDSLLVANSGTNGGVALYSNLGQGDSLEADFQPVSTVRIEGATSIRGIAFVDSLDVLVAVDYGTGTQREGEQVHDGRIYVIEGIKAYFEQASATVTPTRTISGSLTGLSGPIDVAIDPRSGESRSIYVADQNRRTISRFKLSDNGNVAPETTITFSSPSRTPFGIFLDARGIPQ